MLGNRTFALLVKIRLKDENHNFRLTLPLAVSVLKSLVLSAEPLLALLRGKPGRKARKAADTAFLILSQVEESQPQNFVHVDVTDPEKQVYVDIRTFGFSEGE